MLLVICIWDSYEYEQQSQDDEKKWKKEYSQIFTENVIKKIALNEQNLCCKYMCLSLWIVLKNACMYVCNATMHLHVLYV